MKYPDDFNTPAFPAGKPVAISRFMGTALMVVLLLILCVAGLIIWTGHSRDVHPFLIYINRLTGQWMVVGHNHGQKEITRANALQESLIHTFTNNWFSVSSNAQTNQDLWAKCDRRSECRHYTRTDTKCALFCNMSDEMYTKFQDKVVENYGLRFQSGERLSVVDITAISAPTVNENGGMWTVYATVNSNISGAFNVIAYVNIASDIENYPQTMGYYVKTFYSYRIN